MNHTILCVGKMKEEYWKAAQKEYAKRLTRYGKIEVVEVPDEKAPESASQGQQDQIKQKEGERLLKHIPQSQFVIALDKAGKHMDSIELADFIHKQGLEGQGSLNWVIGGSLGLSMEILQRADYILSFSHLTFPHQLMRVILLEQLYRSMRIITGEPYHK